MNVQNKFVCFIVFVLVGGGLGGGGGSGGTRENYPRIIIEFSAITKHI